MAYRVFPSGQVPTAEVLQKYLMQQVVITCVSGARPPDPVIGMTIFETDTGLLQVWYGAAWAQLAAAGGGDAVRLIKGKKWTGVDTNTGRTTGQAVISVGAANVQNVPVVANRVYRARWHVEFHINTFDIRVEFSAWNGTAGTGTRLGEYMLLKSEETSTKKEDVILEFIWKAATTETIANLNLGARIFDATGANALEVRVYSDFFHATVEDIGTASVWSGL